MDLLSWQRTYQAMDWLHIGSGAGEMFAYGQISRHDSEFTKQGRELVRHLERRVRRPVYYYLYRYYARSQTREQSRRCPSCGGNWLLPTALHGFIDFRCMRCRIISNIAFDVRTSDLCPPTPSSRAPGHDR